MAPGDVALQRPAVQRAGGGVYCRGGERVALMGDSEAILHELATGDDFRGKTLVAYVSRTDHIDWAEALLPLMPVGPAGLTMATASEQRLNQIFPSRKTVHFTNIAKASGIALEDMLFFDNERRNVTDVRAMGVTCVHTPDGMTAELFKAGLETFAASRGGGK